MPSITSVMDVELRSGSRLGRYELLVALGTGGMATVWIARESSDVGDRLVAVKAMLPELARQPQFRTMFLEEGQVVRSLHVLREDAVQYICQRQRFGFDGLEVGENALTRFIDAEQ